MRATVDFDIGEGVYGRGGRRRRAVKSGPDETVPLLDKPVYGQLPPDSPNDPADRRLLLVCVVLGCCLLCGLVVVGIYFAATHAAAPAPPGTTTAAPPSTTTTVPFTTGSTAEAPATGGPAGTEEPGVPDFAIDLAFLCNVPFGNGTCRSVFTYENPNPTALMLPAGSNNYVEPGPAARGQRTLFRDGFHYGGATFLWNCAAHNQARWTIRSGADGVASVAVAPAEAVACPPLPIHSSVDEVRRRRKRAAM